MHNINIHTRVPLCNERNITLWCKFTQLYLYQMWKPKVWSFWNTVLWNTVSKSRTFALVAILSIFVHIAWSYFLKQSYLTSRPISYLQVIGKRGCGREIMQQQIFFMTMDNISAMCRNFVSCHFLTWIGSKVKIIFRICWFCSALIVDANMGKVVMCQKLWKLAGSRQSYCNNSNVFTFLAHPAV